MKLLNAVSTVACMASLASAAKPQGIDVSSHQRNINWGSVKANGVEFAFIKATEGTANTSPEFTRQYTGATSAGIIRGGYHLALPDRSSGATQASYFLGHGGEWSPDGRTLPGALDMEYNAYAGSKCHGLTPSAMVSWIRDFSNTYLANTGRYPIIYTTTDWWKTCTANSAAFSSTNPLWIARYASSTGPLPGGWSLASFWQYADNAAPNPGGATIFNGDSAALQRLARG